MHDNVTTARREVGGFLAALLLYGLFYAAFFAQSFLSGHYIAPSDSLDFGVAGYLSPPALWTQGMYSGYPIAADPQALTWYPVLHLFRVLGADWNIFLIAAYVIASATGFLFVRRLTGSSLAGAFSGFVCGFNALMLGYITNSNQIHAFAWVPLALYGLQLIREGLHRSGAAVTALAIALMWLAGHPQVPVYAMYLAAGVTGGGLLVDRASTAVALTRLRWSGMALALGLALAAIELLPMIELGGFSARASSTWDLYASSALPPRELLTLLVPFAFGGFWTRSGGVPYLGESGDSAYVGLLPVALALAAPFALSRHRQEARLWMAAAVVEALLCLGPATPLGTLFYYAPGYSSFQAPLRHLFLLSLCLAVGSGLAFSELTRQRERRGVVAAGASAAAILAGVGFAAFAWRTTAVRALLESHADYAPWALAWPLVLAGTLVVVGLVGRWLPGGRGGAVAFGVLLIAVQVGDLAVLHYRLPGRRFAYADIARAETVPHPRMVALRGELERTGERVLATDGSQNQFLLPNLTRPWKIPAASGTGSLGIARYLEVLGMSASGRVSPDTLSAENLGIDLFAIRYALVRQDSSLASDMQRQADRWQPIENLHYYESDPDTHYTLFRNRHALPRAWCVSQVVEVGPAEALASIRTGRLPGGGEFDPSRTALVEPGALGRRDDDTSGAAGEVVVDHTRQNRYLVGTSRPCMLVLSEVYYPWWRASIDDRRVELVRVNHTMLGVAVPPGSHIVRLWIEPVSVWIGGAITGAGLLLWSALVFPVGLGFRRRMEPSGPGGPGQGLADGNGIGPQRDVASGHFG